MSDIKVFAVGRCLVGLFPYWIGFSWRRVGGMGRVIDCGFVKVAIAPTSTTATPFEGS